MLEEPLKLTTFLLAQFYRDMFDASNKLEKIKTSSGPLWLLTMWAGIYFPSIYCYHEFGWEQERTPPTYGAAMVVMFDQAAVPLVIAYLASAERVDRWHPYYARYYPEHNFGVIENVVRYCAS